MTDVSRNGYTHEDFRFTESKDGKILNAFCLGTLAAGFPDHVPKAARVGALSKPWMLSLRQGFISLQIDETSGDGVRFTRKAKLDLPAVVWEHHPRSTYPDPEDGS